MTWLEQSSEFLIEKVATNEIVYSIYCQIVTLLHHIASCERKTSRNFFPYLSGLFIANDSGPLNGPKIFSDHRFGLKER